MSADNWDICPRCKVAVDKAATHKRLAASRAYGKVAVDEWMTLQAEASKPSELEQTLREYYEIGVDQNGEFYVSYRAACKPCGFQFTYKHTEKVLAQ